MIQHVKLLKKHGWTKKSSEAKIEAYRRAAWAVTDISYDEEGQVSFTATSMFDKKSKSK